MWSIGWALLSSRAAAVAALVAAPAVAGILQNPANKTVTDCGLASYVSVREPKVNLRRNKTEPEPFK